MAVEREVSLDRTSPDRAPIVGGPRSWSPADGPRNGPARFVLYVDDREERARSFRRHLEDLGCLGCHVRSIGEAERMLNAFVFDVVICALDRAEGNLLQAVPHGLFSRQSAPMIATSDERDVRLAAQCRLASFAALVTAPYSAKALGEAIDSAVGDDVRRPGSSSEDTLWHGAPAADRTHPGQRSDVARRW